MRGYKTSFFSRIPYPRNKLIPYSVQIKLFDGHKSIASLKPRIISPPSVLAKALTVSQISLERSWAHSFTSQVPSSLPCCRRRIIVASKLQTDINPRSLTNCHS